MYSQFRIPLFIDLDNGIMDRTTKGNPTIAILYPGATTIVLARLKDAASGKNSPHWSEIDLSLIERHFKSVLFSPLVTP